MKLLLLTALIASLFAAGTCRADTLAEGDQVPEGVIALNQDGTEVRLDDYRGKWLILYFYPKDDTPGCTREAITFSGLVDQFQALNAVVLGVSTDSQESHRKFIAKHDLKIQLLSDTEKVLTSLFDVKTTFGFCSRDTMLINPQGKLEKVYRGVSPEGNPKDILVYIQNAVR